MWPRSTLPPASGRPRPATDHGRWYPTLLTLPDGRILAVSGKNDTTGDLNAEFEVYDPALDKWVHLHPPQNFVGLPFYAHLFVMADGRLFFSGGRMDDDRPQQAGIHYLGHQPVGFQPVPALLDGVMRNQSASVLLPPAQSQQVMIIGGGPGMEMANATGHTETVDLDQAAPTYLESTPMSLPLVDLAIAAQAGGQLQVQTPAGPAGPTRLVHADRGGPGPGSFGSPLDPPHLSTCTDGKTLATDDVPPGDKPAASPCNSATCRGQGRGITGAAG